MNKTMRTVVGVGVIALVAAALYWLSRDAGVSDPGPTALPARTAAVVPPPAVPTPSRVAPIADPVEEAIEAPIKVDDAAPAPEGPWTPYVGLWEGSVTVTSASRRAGEFVNAAIRLVVDAQGEVTLEVKRTMASDGEVHGMVNLTQAWPPNFDRDGKIEFASPSQATFSAWWLSTEEGQVAISLQRAAGE